MAAKRGKAPRTFDFQWPYPRYESVTTGSNGSEYILKRGALIRVLWGADQKALKLGSRWVLNWERKIDADSEEALLAKINAILAPLGCSAAELGPNSVGVQGDGRVYWPCVYVAVPETMTLEEIADISNKITNEVPGTSKVLTYLIPS